MKKCVLYVLIPLVCMIGAFISFSSSLPNGDTLESRETLLNHAISKAKGNDWSIAKEIEIDDYIISCAYSTDGKSTIAVFEPVSSEKYKFRTSINRHNEDIIIGGTVINGEWYDLVWFNGAQTEYAEITYTVNGVRNETLKYDTTNMDLICIKNPEKIIPWKFIIMIVKEIDTDNTNPYLSIWWSDNSNCLRCII